MKNKNWFWGLIFLMSAVFVIASGTDSFGEIGLLSILATIFLVAIIVQSIFSLNYFGVFIPLAILYMIYQEPLRQPEISIWMLLLTGLLTSIGFSILFRSHPKNFIKMHKEYNKYETSENIDNNNPYAKVAFGSSSKYLHSDSLQSAQFTVSFGELNVYFDQAKLSPEGADVFLDCSFGAINLFIPRNWRVQDSLHAILGGVDNKSRGAVLDADSPLLKLSGNVQFGGIEIHYI